MMMNCAQRNGELIANLEAKSSGLCVAYMMCVSRRASANETRLSGDKAWMFFAANSPWFTDCKDALVNLLVFAPFLPRVVFACCQSAKVDAVITPFDECNRASS